MLKILVNMLGWHGLCTIHNKPKFVVSEGKQNRMRLNTIHFTLTTIGLTALCLTTSRPVAAQNLTYTLSGVTFNDGAVATGYFDYNPMTHTFGEYDITTTNGVTDSLSGSHYILGTNFKDVIDNDTVVFQAGTYPLSELMFDTYASLTSPGTFAIRPGEGLSSRGFVDSGEIAPTGAGRIVETGSLVVTNFAPVPEASTTVSFGLLLALGLGGVVIAARKKKATA